MALSPRSSRSAYDPRHIRPILPAPSLPWSKGFHSELMSSLATWSDAERWVVDALDDLPTTLHAIDKAWHAASESTAAPTLTRAHLAALACQIIVCDWSSLQPLALWAERLRNAPLHSPRDSQGHAQLLLASGWLCAIDHGAARPPEGVSAEDISTWGREALRVSIDHAYPNLIASASEQLCGHASQAGGIAQIDLVLDMLAAVADRLDPRVRERTRFWAAAALRMLDQHERAQAIWQSAMELADTLGWKWLKVRSVAMTTRPALECGDTVTAKAGLATLRTLVDVRRPLDAYEVHFLAGWLHMIEGEHLDAEYAFRLAVEDLQVASMVATASLATRTAMASAIARQSQYQPAIEAIGPPPQHAEGRIAALSEGNVALLRALEQRRCGSQASTYREALALAFTRIAQLRGFFVFRFLAPELAELVADALDADIERSFLTELVARRNLLPPVHAGPHWPWRVRVESFGGFRCTVEGKQLDAGRKSNDMRLELLKLIAARSAEPVAIHQVIDSLWPDSSVENGRKSFDMTLSRLRKMLADDEALTLVDARLHVNHARVYVDTRALARLEEQLAGGAQGPVELATLARRLTHHYAHGFLADDGRDTPWKLEAHERFRQRFLRAADHVAQQLWDQDRHAAIALLERAIAAEPIAEPLYVHLIKLHAAAGQHAEALRTYRRLKDILSIMLNTRPAADTEALMRRLVNAV
jgi:LuxR family transcriptional regulator, maltose regulon positive regulatory protein